MSEQRPFSGVLEKLRRVGIRPTRQRLALAKLLFEGGDRHLTAEMVHEEAQAANIRISLATVYNSLHEFRRAGLLREIVVDAHATYFDTNISNHHHFYFEDTGKVADIPGNDVDVQVRAGIPDSMSIDRIDVVVRLRSGD